MPYKDLRAGKQPVLMSYWDPDRNIQGPDKGDQYASKSCNHAKMTDRLTFRKIQILPPAAICN